MNDYGYTPKQAREITCGLEMVVNDLGMFTQPWPQPDAFPTLGEYLEDCGVGNYFPVKEITTPHHRKLARSLGYDTFVPPMHLWPLTAIVVRVSDLIRGAVGRSVHMRNHWRPISYNVRVTGGTRYRSLRGDHSNCCAVDLDFQSSNDRRRAEGVVRALSQLFPSLEMSVGFGHMNLHVGVLSPRGHRKWKYKGYRDRYYKVLP